MNLITLTISFELGFLLGLVCMNEIKKSMRRIS